LPIKSIFSPGTFVTQAIFIFTAVLAGAVLAVQVGVNVQLRNSLGDPITSTLVSFVAGTIGLAVYALVTRAPWPTMSSFSQVPAWQWTGGLLGAVYVVSTILVGPRLGAATLLSLVVAGQMIAAMVLDHHGWLGFAQHAVNVWRIAGALLLIAGTVLVLRN
jgi:transporter family-2 protein